VFDRGSRGAETGTRQLRMDFDNLFLVAYRPHISRVVMRLPKGQSGRLCTRILFLTGVCLHLQSAVDR